MSQIKESTTGPPSQTTADADLTDDPAFIAENNGPIGITDVRALNDIISAFLRVVPKPSDQQVHQLATIVGLPYEEFEEIIFRIFSDEVTEALDREDVDSTGELLEEVQEMADDDPVTEFMILYLIHNPSPSDSQVHSLADMLGVTPEELEERLYSLLAELHAESVAVPQSDS